MSDPRERTEFGGRIVFPYAGRLCLLGETEDVIVVDKPAGMPVHPSKPDETGTLWNHLCGLLAYECVNGGRISIITRLDRETSGVTLIAKHRSAARSLCRRMEAHRIHKTYLALVFGWPSDEEWVVDAPLLRLGSVGVSRIWLKQGVHPEGYASRTRFRVMWRGMSADGSGRPVALLRAQPESGRMHQIRVHSAWSGFPLVGDKIYGADEGCYLEFIETGWTAALGKRLILPRHALHAWRLSYEEPDSEWVSDLPADFFTVVRDVAGLREAVSRS